MAKIRNFDSFWGCVPTYPIFGPLSKNNIGMAALRAPAGNKKRNKERSHFFVYSRRATHDPHHTWHGDRGGQSHFCTP